MISFMWVDLDPTLHCCIQGTYIAPFQGRGTKIRQIKNHWNQLIHQRNHDFIHVGGFRAHIILQFQGDKIIVSRGIDFHEAILPIFIFENAEEEQNECY